MTNVGAVPNSATADSAGSDPQVTVNPPPASMPPLWQATAQRGLLDAALVAKIPPSGPSLSGQGAMSPFPDPTQPVIKDFFEVQNQFMEGGAPTPAPDRASAATVKGVATGPAAQGVLAGAEGSAAPAIAPAPQQPIAASQAATQAEAPVAQAAGNLLLGLFWVHGGRFRRSCQSL